VPILLIIRVLTADNVGCDCTDSIAPSPIGIGRSETTGFPCFTLRSERVTADKLKDWGDSTGLVPTEAGGAAGRIWDQSREEKAFDHSMATWAIRPAFQGFAARQHRPQNTIPLGCIYSGGPVSLTR
jgi:hypothetical protein